MVDFAVDLYKITDFEQSLKSANFYKMYGFQVTQISWKIKSILTFWESQKHLVFLMLNNYERK